MSTWSYENRVSKHCNFSQLPLSNSLIMFTDFLVYVVFFVFACFVVRGLYRSGCRQNYYLTPPPDFFPYPQFFL